MDVLFVTVFLFARDSDRKRAVCMGSPKSVRVFVFCVAGRYVVGSVVEVVCSRQVCGRLGGGGGV